MRRPQRLAVRAVPCLLLAQLALGQVAPIRADADEPTLAGELHAPVLQEIVDRPGWAGGALVLVITGSGTRVGESFEGTFAPVLHIEYREM